MTGAGGAEPICDCLEGLEWVEATHGLPDMQDHTVDVCMYKNQMDLIFWWDDRVPLQNSIALECSVLCKRMDLVDAFRARGHLWSTDVFLHAVHGKDVAFLAQLRERGCPWDERAFACAAGLADRDVLEYLHDNRCPWSSLTTYYAACHDQLENFVYLHVTAARGTRRASTSRCGTASWTCSTTPSNTDVRTIVGRR